MIDWKKIDTVLLDMDGTLLDLKIFLMRQNQEILIERRVLF